MTINDWRNDVLKATGFFDEHEPDLNSLRTFVHSNMPNFLYRYRSVHDCDLDALKRDYEWLSYPNDYNDPFDARIFVDKDSVLATALNKHINERPDPQLRAVIKLLTGHDKLNIYGDRVDKQALTKARQKFGLKFSSFAKIFAEFSSRYEVLANTFENDLDTKIRGLALIYSFTTEKKQLSNVGTLL